MRSDVVKKKKDSNLEVLVKVTIIHDTLLNCYKNRQNNNFSYKSWWLLFKDLKYIVEIPRSGNLNGATYLRTAHMF